MHHCNTRDQNRSLHARERIDLKELDPSTAIEMYLKDKNNEYAESTLKSHRSRLSQFVEYCNREEIENLNTLTGRDLHNYRMARREDGGLNIVSEKTQQDTLRVFIRWCEAIDAVQPRLSEKVQSPSLTKEQNARDEMISAEQASSIVAHLEKYQYASLEHVVWLLLTKTGMRIGTEHALDVDDYRSGAADPHLEVHHRPGETPIKNRKAGERCIFLTESTCRVIDDFCDDQRPEIKDKFGRDPLLATSNGRISVSTIRKYTYKWTRPCVVSGECPHGKDPETCLAAGSANQASKCPSSRSPHSIRRGYITHELKEGIPEHIIGDRVNANPSTLKNHYDQRTEEEKMAQRKELLRAAHREGSKYSE